ncbi:exodeoxyribonuclease VII small subunit [Candidatus Providencia siddallii]|uniref:Exodeoxyribonuclease 7 small subunit n=1 Tax=Candidatus Providencia siddallii TaxID=1715285 RepID=A0ABP1CFX8_9GAMM
MTKEKNKQTQISFENSLKELEDIVTLLESGKLSLEEAINKFEQGIKIVKTGQDILQKAEQRVQILLSDNENKSLENFQPNIQ